MQKLFLFSKKLNLITSSLKNSFSVNIKQETISEKLKAIPDIKTFIQTESNLSNDTLNSESYIIQPGNIDSQNTFKKYYIETYGCQMNENDTEIISTILEKNNFIKVEKIQEANVILTNTCAIRESAEEKVWNKIQHIKGFKKNDPDIIFGILGCMAERMKDQILNKSNNIVDLIVGPDAYRDLPNLINILSEKGNKFQSRNAMNVQLSLEETYADIIPVRKSGDNMKVFISIMRGCNNMCSFCIVPFTRGRERSRNFASIVDEVKMLRDMGTKEITLLGQNVNSFLDETYFNEGSTTIHINSPGFGETYKLRNKKGLRFAELIDKLSDIAPEIRFRFTSPHPKDFPKELIDVIKNKSNICKQIHLPAQSGNSKVLKKMRRNYTREAYIELVNYIRDQIPLVSFSSDFIAGFCGETELEFQDTLSLLKEVKFDMAYLFAYSMRNKTHAYHNLKDDIDKQTKMNRLRQMIEIFKKHQLEKNREEIGSYHLVLIEGNDKKFSSKLYGRTDTNKICVFDDIKIPLEINKFLDIKSHDSNNSTNFESISKGEYVVVKIDNCSQNTLHGTAIVKVKQLKDFFSISGNNPYIKNINL